MNFLFIQILEKAEHTFEIRLFKIIASRIKRRNWVFATNSDFLIPISLHPNVLDLRFFKLWILLDQIITVWNIWISHNWKFEFVAQFLCHKSIFNFLTLENVMLKLIFIWCKTKKCPKKGLLKTKTLIPI